MNLKKLLAVLLLSGSAAALPAKGAVLVGNFGAGVSDSVVQILPTTWMYSFSITNLSAVSPAFGSTDLITGYELPYFTDSAISSIHAPTGWSYQIESTTPFLFNGVNSPGTLKWFAISNIYGIKSGGSTSISLPSVTPETLSGFSFSSAFAPVKSPFTADHIFGTFSFTSFGDPGLPGSPDAMNAGLRTPYPATPLSSNVPEPGTLALFGLGLLGLSGLRRKITK